MIYTGNDRRTSLLHYILGLAKEGYHPNCSFATNLVTCDAAAQERVREGFGTRVRQGPADGNGGGGGSSAGARRGG